MREFFLQHYWADSYAELLCFGLRSAKILPHVYIKLEEILAEAWLG